MFLLYDLKHFRQNVGMAGGYVVIFMRVGDEVEEMGLTFLNNQFPVAHAHTNLVGFMKLPI